MSGIKISVPPTQLNKEVVGLHSAAAIMKRWGASQEQMASVLGVSPNTLARAESNQSETIELDTAQLERISYVLNMHAALRVIFENPINLYGFMSMPNGNAFFNGRKPLDVIADGSITSLYETSRRLNALRSGGW